MASTIKVRRYYLFPLVYYKLFIRGFQRFFFVHFYQELGWASNTPTATIEGNKISFATLSKFPFSYFNHPQPLKTWISANLYLLQFFLFRDSSCGPVMSNHFLIIFFLLIFLEHYTICLIQSINLGTGRLFFVVSQVAS